MAPKIGGFFSGIFFCHLRHAAAGDVLFQPDIVHRTLCQLYGCAVGGLWDYPLWAFCHIYISLQHPDCIRLCADLHSGARLCSDPGQLHGAPAVCGHQNLHAQYLRDPLLLCIGLGRSGAVDRQIHSKRFRWKLQSCNVRRFFLKKLFI